jgi:aspartate kinase
MALIVQKFGGSSVCDREHILNVARVVGRTYNEGHDVAVVVSAQGDTTDDLIEKAAQLTQNPSAREMDVLLSTGEMQSMALLAMALGEMGLPAISLTGWQAGFETNRNYGRARIKNLDTERISSELGKRRIVIVAGFQGINVNDDITTLGRGGSDTSAVAIAAALQADRCQIYTDVDGVYTADPRIVPGARKLDVISFDEMLELATLGAQVLQNRSVELAKKYGVELEVLSSFNPAPGTIVREVTDMKEGMLIKGVTKDTQVAVVTVPDVPDVPGVSFKIFSLVSQKKINVDIILQASGREGNKDIIFTVPADKASVVRGLLMDNLSRFQGHSVEYNTDVAKVSVVGAGMQSHSGVAARMFEALYEANINIMMVATSEIKISVIVKKEDADRAVQAVHQAFEEMNGG